MSVFHLSVRQCILRHLCVCVCVCDCVCVCVCALALVYRLFFFFLQLKCFHWNSKLVYSGKNLWLRSIQSPGLAWRLRMSSKQTFSALNPTPQLSARNLGGKSYSQIGLQRVSSMHPRRQSTWLYLHSICPAQSLSCVFISICLCFL